MTRPWFVGVEDPEDERNLVIYTDPAYIAAHEKKEG